MLVSSLCTVDRCTCFTQLQQCLLASLGFVYHVTPPLCFVFVVDGSNSPLNHISLPTGDERVLQALLDNDVVQLVKITMEGNKHKCELLQVRQQATPRDWLHPYCGGRGGGDLCSSLEGMSHGTVSLGCFLHCVHNLIVVSLLHFVTPFCFECDIYH